MREKKEPVVYKGILMDSDEEMFFAAWLDEMMDHNLVFSWEKCQDAILLTPGLKIPYVKTTQLKTKVKYENKEYTLLRESEYTPDFKVQFTNEGFKKFVYFFREQKGNPKDFMFYTNKESEVWFEVKPSFDYQNMTRTFTNNQKFTWDVHKIFVNLIEPEELFEKTFMPVSVMSYFKYIKGNKKLGKKPGDWKTKYIPKTIDQFLKL
jgi:hypothetical protein